jgi:ATP-binding cassette subfamily F protein uup
LETEQTQLETQLGDPDLYKQAPQQIAALQARHEAINAELTALLERWEILQSP